MDNDGDLDLLVTVNDGSPILLINESEVQGSWLGVKLVGVSSNRDGLGAEVRVRAGDRTQIKPVLASGSYLCAHDPRVLFGLGAVESAELLEVRWPSGARTVVEDPPLGRYLVVREDTGILPAEGGPR